jgi:hypothetical protein
MISNKPSNHQLRNKGLTQSVIPAVVPGVAPSQDVELGRLVLLTGASGDARVRRTSDSTHSERRFDDRSRDDDSLRAHDQ